MNGQQLEDADIAQLIHDVADGWTMPPVRLDAPAWRARVRSPEARRVDAARGWLARLGRAATAAVALTVAATLIAVVINLPQDPGRSPAPSDGPTPLPKLLANGEPPSPSRLLVQMEEGDFSIADLADGSIGRPIDGARPGSAIQVRTDGTLVCLCVSESDTVAGNPTSASATLQRFAADGTPISSKPIRSFTGEPDPRDEGRLIPDRPPHVLTAMSFSEGGAFGFIGWSARAHPVWKSGLIVVDLRTGDIVSELALPDVTTGGEGSRRVLRAPRVLGSASGELPGTEELVIGRSWYEFSPPESENARYTFDVDAFRVGFAGGVLGVSSEVPGIAGCGDLITVGGGLEAGAGTWVACTQPFAAATTIRRTNGVGESLPDVTVAGAEGIEGDVTAVSRDGGTVYAWNPASAMLTKVDLATGEQTTGEGTVARAEPGPLTVLGRWLAPVAAAKSFLRSSVIVSPDGSRVYAIGVKEGVGNLDSAGSAGVFVFDAATLELIDIYLPTADFVSLAIGANGRFVFAAGLPGVDTLGRNMPGQGASITAFDTADGTPRVVAGQLGNRRITFGPEPLR